MTTENNPLDQIERLQKRLAREKQAREYAEHILEKKSYDLYELNRKLDEKNSKLERRIDLAFSATGDGLWERTLADNRMWFSKRFLYMLGYRQNDLAGNWNDWLSVWQRQDTDQAACIIEGRINPRGGIATRTGRLISPSSMGSCS